MRSKSTLNQSIQCERNFVARHRIFTPAARADAPVSQKTYINEANNKSAQVKLLDR